MPPKKVAKPRPPDNGAKSQALWDDPDSASDGDDAEDEKAATFGDLADGGGGDVEESASGEDMKGSDSDDGKRDDVAWELARQALRKVVVKPKAKAGNETDEDGLWDPLAGVKPRKRRKVGQPLGHGAPAARPAGPAAAAASGDAFASAPSWESTFGFPDGSAVCLVNLQKAPHLNGQVGSVAAPLDRATGRCQIIMRDGTVKSLKQENLREVLTGAVVRIHGLQGAADLNGRIAECGDLDLASGRYMVSLADGKETAKKVKETNLELVRRYVAPAHLLSVQRCAFAWGEEIRLLGGGGGAQSLTWAEQLKRLADLGLPAPRFIPAESLATGAGFSVSTSSDQVPIDENGKIMCRLLAVSCERDVCIPAEALRAVEVERLVSAAIALHAHDAQQPAFFLLPQTCVKPLPCLRGAATCGWPLYLQLCQGLLCLDTAHRTHKAWCRAEALLAGAVMSKPLYLLSNEGEVVVGGSGNSGGWLLSDRSETVPVGAPMDGQVVPAERRLLERLLAEALPEGVRNGAKLTAYRL